jgi:hypothetical protein
VSFVCLEHGLNLAALRQYVTDGRPDVDLLASRFIAEGECPACVARYAASEVVVHVGSAGTRVSCSCCGTAWVVEDEGWVAEVGPGLVPIGSGTTLPTGVTIDASAWRIEAFDASEAVVRILRAELTSTPDIGVGLDQRVDNAIEDLLDGVEAATRGQAVAEAEVYRSVTDNGLDPVTAQLIESTAIDALSEINRLLDRKFDPLPSLAADVDLETDS